MWLIMHWQLRARKVSSAAVLTSLSGQRTGRWGGGVQVKQRGGLLNPLSLRLTGDARWENGKDDTLFFFLSPVLHQSQRE